MPPVLRATLNIYFHFWISGRDTSELPAQLRRSELALQDAIDLLALELGYEPRLD